MSRTDYRQFFLSPADPRHRRYEALRSLFVEQQPLDQVARQFGISYGTLSNWASEFRSQCESGQRPPFS